MTDPIPPLEGIRVSSATPARRPQQVTRDRDRERERRHSDERPDDQSEPDEGEGPHVDVLA